MDKTVEVRLLSEGDRQKQILVHNRIAFSHYGAQLLELVKVQAVAFVSDGETSTGYAKNRPLTPDEIVTRATAIVDQSFAVIESRGWMVITPELDSIVEERGAMAGFTGERK